MMFVPPPGANNSLRLDRVVKRLRLASGCKLILDAADARSYASGQSWLDRSGGGYDFYLGATGSSEGSDPAFTGTPGTLGAYWAFDGGDWFAYDSANETWMNNLHKSGAKCTFLFWLYIPDLTANNGLFSTRANTNNQIGVSLHLTSAELLVVQVSNNPSSVMTATSAGAVPQGAWALVAISVDEAAGAGGSHFFINGSSETFNGAYTSPSSSAATSVLSLMSRNGFNPFQNGSRIAAVAAWEGVALTAAQLTALYQATRRRFGV